MILNSWIVYIRMFVCRWSFAILSSHVKWITVCSIFYWVHFQITCFVKKESTYWASETKGWNKPQEKKTLGPHSSLVNISKPFSHGIAVDKHKLCFSPLWLTPSGVMSIGQRWDQATAVNAASIGWYEPMIFRWKLVCLRASGKSSGRAQDGLISEEFSSKNKCVCDRCSHKTLQQTSGLGVVDLSARTPTFLPGISF